MKITKKDFEKYEAVRSSGVTNMWDVRMVESLSGLPEEKIMEIIKSYKQLDTKYPEVRRG